MTVKIPDIDIDLKTTFNPKDVFDNVTLASMVKSGKISKHPCGAYFQSVPVDAVSGLCAIPYDQAPRYNLLKIDFLHLALLDAVTSKDEVRKLTNTEPNWKLLEDREVVEKLFQLGKHYELVKQLKPSNVLELADCIAMIRPNKKQYIDAYIEDKYTIRPLLYRTAEDDKSSYKKSHAIAYALTIVLQLHLIDQGRL